MNQAETQQARQYLLGTASEAEAEQVEFRLITDPDYVVEYQILVDQIIDQYVKGMFEGEEIKRVEDFFLKSEERREKLRFALALKRVETERRKRNQLKLYLPIAAAVIVAMSLGTFLWRSLRERSGAGEALVALNAAYQKQRPTETRISGLNYAPFVPTRGVETVVDKTELQRAELTLLNTPDKSSPAVHHALGQVYLAKRQFDDAIKEFDAALKLDSRNAVLYSDLGAAWLEKGKESRSEPGKNLESFARSLENLNHALELQPDLLAALFNRGIVYQYLLLNDNAEADWEQYLKRDSSSGWAEDARQKLQALKEQKSKAHENRKDFKSDFLASFKEQNAQRAWEIIRSNRNSATPGSFVRDQLVDDYLQASQKDDAGNASELLQTLAFLGEIESKQINDAYTSELARYYAKTSVAQRATLSNARQLMTLGQSYHNQSKPTDAILVFKQAQDLFTRAGNSWEADFAELWIGYCHLNADNTAQSINILAHLAQRFEHRHYRWLQMRALHLLSGAEYNLREYSRAIDHNLQSLAIAEDINDSRGAFNTLSILVEQYRYIGNYEQALHCIQQGLKLIDSCDLNADQLGQYYSIIAAALSTAELYRAAADYQQAALQVTLQTNDAQTISRAYANLGTIYGKLGRYDEGLHHAAQGYETAKSLSDESVRKGMLAYSAQRIGDLYRKDGEVFKALEKYGECLSIYQGSDNFYGLYEARKSVFLSYLANGNDAAADEELKKTLTLLEEHRSQILEEDNRHHFFGNEQSVYDLAIDFEYSRKHDFESAFNYSEASRSRSLLDLIKLKGGVSTDSHNGSQTGIVFDSMSQPLNLREIKHQMPVGTQIVQYAVLENKLLIWLISRSMVHAFEKTLTQAELARKVSRYVELVSTPSASNGEIVRAGKELFEYLISPVASLLDRDSIIYFVPDKSLNYLPFAALVSPASNRFLVQDYTFAIAPSASLFVNSSNLARAETNISDEKILAVGNPRFNSSEFPNLEDLPSAKKEAEEIARMYNPRSVLTEGDATKAAVQTEMEKANVIHFAVHSILNPHLPMFSKLVLAEPDKSSAAEGSSDLEAQDIYKMNLTHARLVVLSSCESGIGKYYGGEGVMSLARPFLAGRVPLVVISLWPVDSETTSQLMIQFHKHRKRDNASTVEALRQAQLDLLNGANPRSQQVYAWASFATVGGQASF
jgi:CHAT domain-containing protein